MATAVSNKLQPMHKPLAGPPPRAVLFDAYGTLFDVYSVGLAAGQLFPGAGEPLAQLWRDKQIEYTRLCSMSGRYQPFRTLTQAALRYSAERRGRPTAAQRVPPPVGLPGKPRGAGRAEAARHPRRHPFQR
jgi:hypothetical protein